MNWDRWRWLDRVVLLLLALLRGCWLWPWLELSRRGLTSAQAGPLLSLPVMIGLMLGGAMMAHQALRKPHRLSWARLIVAGTGLAAIVLALWWQFYQVDYTLVDWRWLAALGLSLVDWSQGVPAPFITLLAAAYLWWQGLLDGLKPRHHEEVWTAFAIGFVILALAVAVGTAAPGGSPASGLILPFFAAGLAALALSSLKTSREWRGREVKTELNPNRYWLISVASVIIALLGIGVALSVLVTPELVARSLHWTSVVLDILGQALLYLLLVFSYLVFLILEPLIYLIRALRSSEVDREPIQPFNPAWPTEPANRNPVTLPPLLTESLPWLGLALLFLGLGLLFALALRRFWLGSDEEIEETRDLILSRALLREQLANLWRCWLRRFKSGATYAQLNLFLALGGEPDSRRAVRAIYQALLAAARAQGQSRQSSQTPLEYERALAESWPDSQAALNTITAHYLQARYGADEPAPAQVEQTRLAWAELQTMFAPQNSSKAESNES